MTDDRAQASGQIAAHAGADAAPAQQPGQLAGQTDGQARAREMASRLRVVIESLGQAIVIAAGQDGPAEVNAAAGRLLGLPSGEVESDTLADAVRALGGRATDAEAIGAATERLLTDHSAEIRDWHWSFDGSPSHLRVNSMPLIGEGLSGRIWIFDDISTQTALLEAERAARAHAVLSEQRYRLMAENASDVVFQGNNNAVVTWLSPSVQEVLGRPADQFIGHPVTELIDAADIPAVLEASRRAAAGQRVTYRARYRHANGELRWCEVTARPLFDEAGNVLSRVGSLRDVHEQVVAELALVESEQEARRLATQFEVASKAASEASLAKTTFLSRMSHELRTPLNAVLGFAQLLAMDPLTDDQRDAVQHIRTGGKHLLELINEILDIARIEEGRLSLTMEAVEAGDAVREALDLVRPLAAAAGVSVADFEADTCGIRVWANRQRVIQVMMNLLTNAVKYNRSGGAVTITCELLQDGMAAIRVRDSGMGIPDELRSRLFQPFDRLGAEATGVEGTGLGLTLSQGLARAMSGWIEVDSVVGEGSVFSLVLQSAVVRNDEVTTAPLPPLTPAVRATRVQYIEDNPANVQLMSRIVGLRDGATLTTAADGQAGLAMVLEDPPDLLLLDVHLQAMRGDEVLQALRADVRTRDLPIVVVTADASRELRQYMTALGATGFLTKPVEVREVLRWIDDPNGGKVT